VGEVLAEAVPAIMTIQTGITISGAMFCCEGLVYLTMTGGAGCLIKSRDVGSVAIRAVERFILSLELVRIQVISRKLMRIFPIRDLGEQSLSTAMFRMTIATLRFWVDRVHSSVWCLKIGKLGCDIRMTNHTTVIHGLGFPGRNVTATAGSGNISVRSNTAN